MRIHAVAAVYVLFFSPFLGVSRGEYALELLCCGFVFAAECMNTALETLADRVHPARHPLIGRAKDAAAGAVLAAALFSAAVGVTVLWRPAEILALLASFAEHPLRLIALLASLAFAVWFICGAGAKKGKSPKEEDS